MLLEDAQRALRDGEDLGRDPGTQYQGRRNRAAADEAADEPDTG